MTRYGRSPWLERFPRVRVPSYPRLRESTTTEVVVVGGGMTGCATAYAFAAAGVKVVLLEGAHVGQGSSASAFGWISDTPDWRFETLVKAIGVRSARRAWQAWRRSALDFSALLRRLEVRCGLEPGPSLTVARTPEQAAALGREAKTRKGAGLEAVLVPARTATAEAGTEALGVLRTRDGSVVDPYRATIGLAAAAAARSAAIHERSPVKRIRSGTHSVEVAVGEVTVTASRVVVTTGLPTDLFTSLARHVRPQQLHLVLTGPVPARVRKTFGAPAAITSDAEAPPHHIRWMDGDRLLVAGAAGAVATPRGRERQLVQRTGQLMYELSTIYPAISGIAPSHGWDMIFGRTGDGLPVVGPHRNHPRHLFAFGGSGHSVTEAYLASRILLRHYFAETGPMDDVFGFTRG